MYTLHFCRIYVKQLTRKYFSNKNLCEILHKISQKYIFLFFPNDIPSWAQYKTNQTYRENKFKFEELYAISGIDLQSTALQCTVSI